MCGGGGNAAKAAQQQEAQRQANVTQAVQSINALYGSPQRQQQYSGFEDAIQARNLNKLDQEQVDANRNLNFAMARQGLTGGSVDADSAAKQEREYNQGVLRGEQAASQAAAALKQKDMQAKQNLIGLAESGLDATSASTQGLESMQANIQHALASAQQNELGDAFSGLGNYFAESQKAKQLRQLYGNPSSYGLYGSAPQQYTGPGATANFQPPTQPMISSWYGK